MSGGEFVTERKQMRVSLGPWLDEIYQALCQTIGNKMERQRYSMSRDRRWRVSSVTIMSFMSRWQMVLEGSVFRVK